MSQSIKFPVTIPIPSDKRNFSRTFYPIPSMKSSPNIEKLVTSTRARESLGLFIQEEYYRLPPPIFVSHYQPWTQGSHFPKRDNGRE